MYLKYDMPFQAIQDVTEIEYICWYIALETIAYATVISANRPGLWPCLERYADKQVTRKARHNIDGVEPYEKTKVVPSYPDNDEIIY